MVKNELAKHINECFCRMAEANISYTRKILRVKLACENVILWGKEKTFEVDGLRLSILIRGSIVFKTQKRSSEGQIRSSSYHRPPMYENPWLLCMEGERVVKMDGQVGYRPVCWWQPRDPRPSPIRQPTTRRNVWHPCSVTAGECCRYVPRNGGVPFLNQRPTSRTGNIYIYIT